MLYDAYMPLHLVLCEAPTPRHAYYIACGDMSASG
jgi:hypothetical protein